MPKTTEQLQAAIANLDIQKVCDVIIAGADRNVNRWEDVRTNTRFFAVRDFAIFLSAGLKNPPTGVPKEIFERNILLLMSAILRATEKHNQTLKECIEQAASDAKLELGDHIEIPRPAPKYWFEKIGQEFVTSLRKLTGAKMPYVDYVRQRLLTAPYYPIAVDQSNIYYVYKNRETRTDPMSVEFYNAVSDMQDQVETGGELNAHATGDEDGNYDGYLKHLSLPYIEWLTQLASESSLNTFKKANGDRTALIAWHKYSGHVQNFIKEMKRDFTKAVAEEKTAREIALAKKMKEQAEELDQKLGVSKTTANTTATATAAAPASAAAVSPDVKEQPEPFKTFETPDNGFNMFSKKMLLSMQDGATAYLVESEAKDQKTGSDHKARTRFIATALKEIGKELGNLPPVIPVLLYGALLVLSKTNQSLGILLTQILTLQKNLGQDNERKQDLEHCLYYTAQKDPTKRRYDLTNLLLDDFFPANTSHGLTSDSHLCETGCYDYGKLLSSTVALFNKMPVHAVPDQTFFTQLKNVLLTELLYFINYAPYCKIGDGNMRTRYTWRRDSNMIDWKMTWFAKFERHIKCNVLGIEETPVNVAAVSAAAVASPLPAASAPPVTAEQPQIEGAVKVIEVEAAATVAPAAVIKIEVVIAATSQPAQTKSAAAANSDFKLLTALRNMPLPNALSSATAAVQTPAAVALETEEEQPGAPQEIVAAESATAPAAKSRALVLQ